MVCEVRHGVLRARRSARSIGARQQNPKSMGCAGMLRLFINDLARALRYKLHVCTQRDGNAVAS
jgi:hypothetical protein